MRAILLFLSLFAVAPALAADKDKIVGTWKLTSAIYEELASKERGKILGDNPRGYQIATPDRWISIVATEKRPVPKTDEERVLAYRTLISYSGRYRIEGSKITTKVDVASNESWVGADQELSVRFEGEDIMHIESGPMPLPNAENKIVRVIVTWQREKS